VAYSVDMSAFGEHISYTDWHYQSKISV
jgi:hypothetical protein